MNKSDLFLENEIDNLDNLPLETLIKLKQLYDDDNLPKNIKKSLEKEGFYSEKLSELIAQAEYKYQIPSSQSEVEKNITYTGKTFIYDEEKMANGMPVFTGYKAMLEKDAWTEETISKLALYRYEGKSNPNNWIQHYINQANTKEIITVPFAEAIQIIDKFGIDTAKLHLILAVHACRQKEPWKEMFILKGTDLIKDLGWHKRTDLTIAEKLKKIAQLVWAVNCLLVKAKWILGKPKNNKVPVKIETSRIWDIAIAELSQEDLIQKTQDLTDIEIIVRPGIWTYFFLNDGGQAAQTALYHFSWLSESIMSIDPYHEEAALRIAMIQSIAAYRDSFITVETWLKENLTGASSRIEKARSDRRYAHDLKNYWDSILNTLKNVGFTLKFDPKTYPEWLKPNSTEKNKRGYFEKLLQAKVSITPPSSAYLQERQNNPQAIKTGITTGIELKKARESAGLSLKTVADYFEKSPMWLSRKESGKRNLSQSEAKEILRAITILKEKTENE